MEARGINQKWLADAANTTEATISRYVNGVHKPNIDIVVDIAKALGVSVDYLLGLTSVSAYKEERNPELRLLTSCYSKASERDRKLIWGILEDYMTAEERGFISHFLPDEKKSKNSGAV
jgi:transcriptional regulator with XRE-family HTH domain